MDVDGSFAQYVAARWSTHYRLAALLSGPDAADELTQAALVRARLSWPEVQQAPSADGYVTRLLVSVAVRRPNDDVPVPGDEDVPRGGREHLWAQVRALLPRQRAVLVLRHHVGLSDAEIGEALGWSATTVAAEALALETGVDLDDLRDELVRHSDEVRVPLPPVDDLVVASHQARRQRRRRSWTWAGGVAAVVALGLTAASLVQGSSEAPPRARPAAASTEPVVRFLAMLSTGRPPRTAYAVGRTLHLGDGQRLALPELPATVVQTRRWLYVATLSGAIVRVDMRRDRLQVVERSTRGGLVTDPSGEHVAWLAAGPGPAVVVVRTVSDWAVLLSDEQRFPARPRCCDNPFLVNGMTQEGDVIASLPAAHRAWVWHNPDGGTDTQVRAITGLDDGIISQVTSDGIVVHHARFGYAVGALDDGVFRRSTVFSAVQADFSDPFGHRVVYLDEAGEVHVRQRVFRGRSRRGSQDIRLLLPALSGGFAGVRWEDTDHVLLDVADASLPHGALVRCAVDSGTCELAVRFSAPHVVAD